MSSTSAALSVERRSYEIEEEGEVLEYSIHSCSSYSADFTPE